MQKIKGSIRTVLLIQLVVTSVLMAGGKSGETPVSPVVEIEVKPIVKEGPYIGLGLGWMELKDSYTKEYFETYPLTLQIGYQFNNYIAIEGRYTQSVGNVKYDHGTENTPNNDDFPTTFSNLAMYLKPMYPMGDFTLYGLLGYGELLLTDIRSADRSEVGFQWGIGLGYEITESVSIFADYNNLYDAEGFDGRAQNRNVHGKSVIGGVSYAF